jgi:hypothetical protein
MLFVIPVIDQIIRQLSELTTVAPVHWSRSEILGWVNDGIIELAIISGELHDFETVTLSTSSNVVNLPSNIIAPIVVSVNGRDLRRETITDLDRETDFEAVDQVATVPSTWCPFGLTKIIIWPRPTSAIDARVYGPVKPTLVSDTPSSMPLRDEYVPAIQDYSVFRSLIKEGGAETNQGMQFYQRFLDTVSQLSGRNIIRRKTPTLNMPRAITNISPESLAQREDGTQ